MHEEHGGSTRSFARRLIDDPEAVSSQIVKSLLNVGYAKGHVRQAEAHYEFLRSQRPDDARRERSREDEYPDLPPQFRPLPADASPEEKDRHWYETCYMGDRMPQLTTRAVLMGAVLGMLMSISNLYTTLKVGWSFGVAITSCVLSFVIWNSIRTILCSAAILLMTSIRSRARIAPRFCLPLP